MKQFEIQIQQFKENHRGRQHKRLRFNIQKEFFFEYCGRVPLEPQVAVIRGEGEQVVADFLALDFHPFKSQVYLVFKVVNRGRKFVFLKTHFFWASICP